MQEHAINKSIHPAHHFDALRDGGSGPDTDVTLHSVARWRPHLLPDSPVQYFGDISYVDFLENLGHLFAVVVDQMKKSFMVLKRIDSSVML
jgi:hypothetical protein